MSTKGTGVITGEEYQRLGRKSHKYHAEPVYDEDGTFFASKKEFFRWKELRLLESVGQIKKLRRQVTFPLEVMGTLVCSFRPDFMYYEDGIEVVEECKGFKTPTYILKAKLFCVLYPQYRFIES